MIEFESSLETDAIILLYEAKTFAISQQAFEMFINASLECPASITAQGAWIALAIRDAFPQEMPPFYAITLKKALINDESRLKKIANAGNSQHRKKDVNQGPLKLDRVKEIVEFDFDIADEFLRTLSIDSLREIVDQAYPYYQANKIESRTGLVKYFPEDSIRHAALLMMRGEELLRPWRESNPSAVC